MRDERVTDQPTDEAVRSTLPPFKRGAQPTLAGPLLSPGPLSDSAAGNEPASTLLFNDVSVDAPMCDPNDPDCEVV